MNGQNVSPYNQGTHYGGAVYNPVISGDKQQQKIQQQGKQKIKQNNFSADVASLEYMSIANKRNEKFSGNLINIINANQEKDGDIGLNKIRKALLGGPKVLDLSEKIKFVDEKGEAQEYSVEDLATDNKFATLSDVAQQNFLKSFSDPDRGKSNARLKFDKTKKWFLAGFGVVGIGAGLTGTLLAINSFIVGATSTAATATTAAVVGTGFLATATVSSMGIGLAVIGAIGLVIGIAFFVNKIASYVKNSKISKKNANVRSKINDLSTSVHKDKEEVQSKLEELKKGIPKEDLKNINTKSAAADGAKKLENKTEEGPEINNKNELINNTNKDTQAEHKGEIMKQKKFADNETQTESYIKNEQNNKENNQNLNSNK